MNIAILTVYDGLNYGSFLQAYAMNKFLEGYGYNVYFIKRISEQENLKSFTTNRLSNDCGIIKKIWRNIKNIPNYPQISNQIISVKKQFPYFQEAWKELKIIQKENIDNIDCIVCGSDEIWNLNNAYIDTEFYTCSNLGYNIRKIAVAVSIGNTTEEQVLNNANFIKAVNQFESILVRDHQTQNAISNIINKKIDIICDPTLLIMDHVWSDNDLISFEKIISRNIQHDKIDNAIRNMRERSTGLILANLNHCM